MATDTRAEILARLYAHEADTRRLKERLKQLERIKQLEHLVELERRRAART